MISSSRKLESPAGLRLPAKFSAFRPVQVDALKKIVSTDKRWILLQAPTGVGKSLIAAATQRILDKRMLYTCHSKDLQEQFVKDFPYAVELKGRENYPTTKYGNKFPEIHCGLCTKTPDDPRCRWCCPSGCLRNAPCSGDTKCVTGWRSCPYEEQKKKAILANAAVLNFAMFLGEANYAGDFSGKFPLVVCDEADLLESALMGFAELSIPVKTLNELSIPTPKHKTKNAEWADWARETAVPAISQELAKFDARDGGWATLTPREIRRAKNLERLRSKLSFFASQAGTGKWVNCTREQNRDPGDLNNILDALSDTPGRLVWKPVYVSDIARHYLWRHGERFMLMSATILNPRIFARNLGIPDGEWEFIDLPSVFPKENRPVYYIPRANMTHKTAAAEWPKAVEAMDAILDRHPNEKVLVHTVSYALSQSAVANTRHRNRLVTYNGAKGRAAALERFRSSREPLVMLAPSMDRGIDLPDDACRVVIILKVPYRGLGDRQVSARLYGSRDGRAWYIVDAIRSMVQMSGRAVRNETDWAVAYVIDAQFGVLLKEWREAFPAWWLEALETRPNI